MGKLIAVCLWIFGATCALAALYADIRFWKDPEVAFYLGGGLAAIFAGILFFIAGDIEDTLRQLEWRLNRQGRNDGLTLDVTRNDAIVPRAGKGFTRRTAAENPPQRS